MDKKDIALMDDLMEGIFSSKEWDAIQRDDPMITKKQTQLDNIMQKAKEHLPHDLYMELAEAQTSAATAYIEPAILHGIRVATVMRDAAAHPLEFSRYVMECTSGEATA